MLENDTIDWEFWDPTCLFEEKLDLPKYARIRDGDRIQRKGDASRAQAIFTEECKRCDKGHLETCAAAHEAESHRTQGEWEQAIHDYWRAFECFHSNDQPHNIAVTHLMLGLCYQAIANYRDALDHFTRAHTQFDVLLKRHREQGNRRRVGMYRALCEQSLLLQAQAGVFANVSGAATDRVGDTAGTPLPAPPAPLGDGSAVSPVRIKLFITHADRANLKDLGYTDAEIDRMRPEEAHEILTARRTAKREWIFDDGLEEIPILETEVAAFAPGRGFEGERQIGTAHIGSIVFIDDKRYIPINLVDGGKYLNLHHDFDYKIIRVRGQSMNRAEPAPIKNGAWIIVRSPRNRTYIPNHGDIVVVNIPEISGDLLSLKRVLINNSAVWLKSETSEPDLPEHRIRSFTWTFGEEPPIRFQAQAIAVLKLIEQTE
ncbi:MAG: tetratricopeptide repeat protein [Chloroflexi bacterium]|nr:tetratricopeptide repeat protein [Chloroflexota bacterium]